MYFKPNIFSRNLCIRSNAYNVNHKITLNGQKIKQVSQIKFLGVTIDENLTWLPHIENLRKKLSMCHGTLKRIKTSIPKSLYKTMYHALFESHLTYGISVWGAQSQCVMDKLFTIQKKCIRMLFGGPSVSKEYCYCKYGESGIMINCQQCQNWYHDECLGLTEAGIANITDYYCPTCLDKNSNLAVKYKFPLSESTKNTFCHCNGCEAGLMIECFKCKNFFHDECIGLNERDIKQILVYFCTDCIEYYNTIEHYSLKIIYKNYIKEHTKSLFNSHNILTVHNLYTYHTLLELYKILKFRSPYCVFELFSSLIGTRQMDLTIPVPKDTMQCQRLSFVHQAIVQWNTFYKQLIKPYTIPVHRDYIVRFNLIPGSVTIHYDYSTKVSVFKSSLSKLLFQSQSKGDNNSWEISNTMYIRDII